MTDKGSNFVLLSWVAPNPEEHNGLIRHYLVDVHPVNSSSISMSSQRTASNSTSYTVTGLHPLTFYEISVAAVTVAAGPNSEPIEVQTTRSGKNDHTHKYY